MWCAACQTDVAGEISADGQSLICAACGNDVSSVKSFSLHPTTREVRDLLERWSTEELLDPDLPMRHSPPLPHAPDASIPGAANVLSESGSSGMLVVEGAIDAGQSSAVAPSLQSPSRAARPKLRLDSQHTPKVGSKSPVPPPHRRPAPADEPQSRFDGSHPHAPEPHFNIASAFADRKAPGRSESLWGQILAYGGIGLLTVGTVMVLWGYFGGPDNYTPTGWLLATAGQMLLFLGVVTLVSGGMEQTTHEVTRRIQVLGDQIIRIERHQEHVLHGPHFARDAEDSSRTRAAFDRQAASDE